MWTGPEHVFLQGIRHEVSLVLQWEMLYFQRPCGCEGAAAVCRSQLWEEQALLAKLQLVHCFLLRGAWWNCPGSLSYNEWSSNSFIPYNVRFLPCCSKNASKLSGTFLKSFLRENILYGWKALLLLNIAFFCCCLFFWFFVFLNNKKSLLPPALSEWLPVAVSTFHLRNLL